MANLVPPSSNTTPALLPASAPAYLVQTRAWNRNALPDLKADTLKAALPKLLSHPNVAARRRIIAQAAAPGPTVERGGDAGVVRARLDSLDRLIALASGGNPRFSYLNPRRGALIAVVECLRRLACTGAVPLAISSRLAIADPTKPEEAYLLNEVLGGLAEAVEHFGLPELGGGLTLLNAGAPGGDPVPTVSVVGQIEQEKHFTRQYVRSAGERLLLLGAAPTELGGSQYQGIIHHLKTGDAPQCSLTDAHKLNYALLALIKGGLVHGANDLAEGGLLCCVAEMLFTPDRTFGATLDLATLQGNRLDALLFGESQSRAVVVAAPERVGSVLTEAHLRGVSAAVIGEVTAAPALTVRGATEEAVVWPLDALRPAWENSVAEKLNLAGFPA